MKNIRFRILLGVILANGAVALRAADTAEAAIPDPHYGLFGWLDHRSSYGQGAFPEPFLVDDSDLETTELRLDWLRTAAGSAHSDLVKGEVEYGIGLMTLELEVPYERDVADGAVTSGMANINLGARYPLYQFVSATGRFDSTSGVGLELDIPTGSDVSHNTELVPKLFDDLRVGNFTAQAVAGYSMLFGPGDEGGLQTFEYGVTLGYNLSGEALRVPGVVRWTPVFELSGETQANRADAGRTAIKGDAGLRVNLKTFGRIQARPGVVFVFPMDNNARSDAHWGIMASFVFEF